MRTVLRGIGAVIAGLAAGMIIVVALTVVATAILFDGDLTAPPTGLYLVFNIAYSAGAAVFAGWLAGRLAGSRPLLHAAGVAVLMVILSMGGGSSSGEGVPEWYGPTLVVLMPVAALLGGWLRGRSTKGSSTA